MNERSKSKWFLAFPLFFYFQLIRAQKVTNAYRHRSKTNFWFVLSRRFTHHRQQSLWIFGELFVLYWDLTASAASARLLQLMSHSPLHSVSYSSAPPIMTANWTGSTGNDLCFEVVLGPLSKMDEELSHSGGLFLLYITSSQLRCFMNIRRFYLNCFSAINTIPLKWGIVFIANDQETSGKIRITLGELMTPGSPRQSSKRAGDGGRRHLLSRLLLTQSVRKLNRWMDEEKEAQKYTRK